jgi:single-strand DNA-binding protein
MASLNKVILIGRLGKDPEVTSFENGNKKISVTMATSERYRDRDQNWVEQTDWHNIVVWGNLANDIAEGRRNYSKGDMMYVEGKLRTRQYTDQQGAVRYVTEVIADKMMQLAPARPAQQSSYGQPYTPATEPAPTGYTPQGNFDASDEGNDLPF